MTILVTGGAGYVGSHVLRALADRGESTVAVGTPSTGLHQLGRPQGSFVEGGCGNSGPMKSVITEHGVDTILHSGSSIAMPYSVADLAGISTAFGWKLQHANLAQIVANAYAWKRLLTGAAFSSL